MKEKRHDLGRKHFIKRVLLPENVLSAPPSGFWPLLKKSSGFRNIFIEQS